MRERSTARVLLIGPTGRILLIRFEDPRPSGPHVFWATVGGALEPGETTVEAARRELAEETGMTGLEIGPVVWAHQHVMELEGEPVQVKEDYVLVHCPDEQVRLDGMTRAERGVVREARWWTLAELAASEEVIYPAGLAQLVAPLLRASPGRNPATNGHKAES